MSLWDWTLSAYDKSGVPQACLRLQDEHGQNTSFLLWAVWAGGADPASLTLGAEISRDWETRVLGPVREVRRLLKANIPHIEDADREGLRTDIKTAELRAERLLMESLEKLYGRGGSLQTLAALQVAVLTWGRAASDSAVAALAQAID